MKGTNGTSWTSTANRTDATDEKNCIRLSRVNANLQRKMISSKKYPTCNSNYYLGKIVVNVFFHFA